MADWELVPYHDAGCERTEVCHGCGRHIEPGKCRCGFWITLCGCCEQERSLEMTKQYAKEEVERMRKEFNQKKISLSWD